MTKVRLILMAVALLLLPQPTEAQEAYTVARRARLGVLTEPVGNAMTARERVVVEVVAGSAAEKAGVQKGDTIIRFNGLPASQQVMSAPFEAGDTITLRLRRDGRERDVRVIAEAAAEGVFSYSLALPDTVLGRMSIIMDRVRGQMDSVRLPSIRVERTEAGEQVVIVHDDSVRIVSPNRFGFSGETITVDGDSVQILRFGNDTVAIRRALPDSVYRRMMMGPDSASMRLLRSTVRGDLDSVRVRVLRSMEDLTTVPDSAWRRLDRAFSISADTIRVARPGDIFVSGYSVGMRAVAGAELSELNPGLSEYFGTDRGVLVLNARPGTPAAAGGLRAGDVITQVNGEDVRTIADVRRRVMARRNDAAIELRVVRRGETLNLRLDDSR